MADTARWLRSRRGELVDEEPPPPVPPGREELLRTRPTSARNALRCLYYMNSHLASGPDAAVARRMARLFEAIEMHADARRVREEWGLGHEAGAPPQSILGDPGHVGIYPVTIGAVIDRGELGEGGASFYWPSPVQSHAATPVVTPCVPCGTLVLTHAACTGCVAVVVVSAPECQLTHVAEDVVVGVCLHFGACVLLAGPKVSTDNLGVADSLAHGGALVWAYAEGDRNRSGPRSVMIPRGRALLVQRRSLRWCVGVDRSP